MDEKEDGQCAEDTEEKNAFPERNCKFHKDMGVALTGGRKMKPEEWAVYATQALSDWRGAINERREQEVKKIKHAELIKEILAREEYERKRREGGSSGVAMKLKFDKLKSKLSRKNDNLKEKKPAKSPKKKKEKIVESCRNKDATDSPKRKKDSTETSKRRKDSGGELSKRKKDSAEAQKQKKENVELHNTKIGESPGKTSRTHKNDKKTEKEQIQSSTEIDKNIEIRDHRAHSVDSLQRPSKKFLIFPGNGSGTPTKRKRKQKQKRILPIVETEMEEPDPLLIQDDSLALDPILRRARQERSSSGSMTLLYSAKIADFQEKRSDLNGKKRPKTTRLRKKRKREKASRNTEIPYRRFASTPDLNGIKPIGQKKSKTKKPKPD